MTIVIGAHLGDGVGIAADTRVSYGTAAFRDNALKVYLYPPYFIVGIAGDVMAAIHLLAHFYRRHFLNVSRRNGFRQAVNPLWMRQHLVDLYKQLECCRGFRFRLVIAADDTLEDFNARGALEPTMSVTHFHGASFGASASTLTDQRYRSGNRLLMGVAFPSGDIELAEPTEIISAGSGEKFFKALLDQSVLISARALSLTDRFAALSREIERLAMRSKTGSINPFCVGMVLGRGGIGLTLHSYQAWPNDSDPGEYEWEPSDPAADGYVSSQVYSVGFDQRDTEAAWIYRGNNDPRRCTKLRLQNFGEPALMSRFTQRGEARLTT